MQAANLRTETKQIGDLTYTVQVLSVVEGSEALVRLQKLVGPALGELLDGGARAGAARALAGLSAQLTAGDLAWFRKAFGGKTRVTLGQDENGNDLVISLNTDVQQDKVFAGNYLAMFEWLEFCLEVNFADFLAGLRALLARAVPSAPTPTK